MPILQLHLIGGAPLTGKTTLAAKLGKTHRAVVLSTDHIRQWMQGVCNSADYPKVMFTAGGMTAEDYYQVFTTPEAALQEEIAQCKEVEAGILSLLKANPPWPLLILEGIAITPKFASEISRQFPGMSVRTTFLYESDHERIKHRVMERGLWAAADTYSNDVKPLEIDWAIQYNEWFREQVITHNYQLTPVTE